MRYCEVCRASFQASSMCPRDQVRVRADIEDPLLDSIVGGRYRVLERIAAGGMGQIYRAAHTRIASLAAVKMLYGELTHVPEMRARFQREAEAASCLQSRHIVRVIDFGETDQGLVYLVMEHLTGASLAAVIARDGPLAPERAVLVAQQVIRGLAHAHERGIVHRDLKPDNVMLVAEDDDTDVVKLLDFGIAQMRASAKLTSAGQFLGTPHYMAPEQFSSAEVDARADLYALGVMMFETLTGTLPFSATTLNDLAHAHTKEAPPTVRARCAQVDPALEAIVMRLLAKSPSERYPSARAVGDALRALRSGKPQKSVNPGVRKMPRAVGAEVAEQVRAAIQVGAPLYNAGDHGGCARLYRETAEAIVAGGPNVAGVAVAARLRSALERAETHESATHAAWELRYAFDDLIQAADVPIDDDDALRAEIGAAQAIASARYAANDLEAVGEYYVATAHGLAEWLRAAGRDVALADWLTSSARQAVQSGDSARVLSQLGEALESVRVSRTSGLPARVTTSVVPTPLEGPWADGVRQRIASAIGVGAPAYNRGDVAGCLRIYRQTAEGLLTDLDREPGATTAVSRLRAALEQSAGGDVDRGAWTMRRAFDDLLAR